MSIFRSLSPLRAFGREGRRGALQAAESTLVPLDGGDSDDGVGDAAGDGGRDHRVEVDVDEFGMVGRVLCGANQRVDEQTGVDVSLSQRRAGP